MSRNVFGCDEPDPPCEICGRDYGDCICPECPECREYGMAKCYKEHGLVRNQEQIDSFNDTEQRRQENLKGEEEYWQSLKEEWEQEDKEQS